MAGAGYKLFNTGDVLTAAQVNTYLQEQVVMVFANAAARTTALSGVLAEGMVTYLKDTDALEIYSGSAWVGYGSGDITGITTGATSGLTGGVTSGTADLKLNTTAKGGLLVGTGSGTSSELAVGTNGQILTADSTTATGLKWAAASSTTPAYVGCYAYKSADQTISTGTYTAITLTQEDFDTDSFHSTVTNTSRMTIPSGKAGKYLFNFSLQWSGSTTAQRVLGIYKNGTQFSLLENPAGGTANSFTQSASIVMDLAVNDYVELFGYQNTGGNLTVYGTGSGNGRCTYVALTYLGA